MQRRTRLALIAIGVLLGLLLLAALIVRSLLSPARFTDLVQQAASEVGLVLELERPAEPALFPQLSVNMHGVVLHMPGEPALLRARQVHLVVPWSSVLGGEPTITRLEIDSPRVDLVQVQHWLRQLPPTPTRDGPPKLPDIDAGVRIRDGLLVSGNDLLLNQFALDTGALHMGQRFTLEAEAITADGSKLALHLAAVPRQDENTLQFDAIELHLSSGDSTTLTLTGELLWRGRTDLRGELVGQLVHALESYAVSVSFAEESDPHNLSLVLRIDNETTHVALTMSPRVVWKWWQSNRDDGSQLALPPVLGTVTMEQLDMGSLHVEGLRIDSTLPAPGGSVSPTPDDSVAPTPAHSADVSPGPSAARSTADA